MRAREPEEQGYVVRDGVRIFWERFGDSGPWVLFVPTWNIVHSRSWKMQVPHLARRFRVLTFDPRGNGLSDRPASGYRIEDHAMDALAVLDHHGVDRAALITASQGANAALWLALEHPGRIERVALLGQGVGVGPVDEVVAFIRADYEGFIEGFFGACFNEPHSTKPIEDTIGWARETTPEVLAAGAADFDPELIRPRLGEVASPTLLVHGSNDVIVGIDEARAVAAAIPDSELVVVEGGGHRPDIRDPVLGNSVLDDFLGDGARSREHTIARSPARRARRALYVSSPIGLGHVRRDLAIADELRARCPDLEIDWLAQPPAAAVLEASGESIHPASAQLAGEVAHVESYAREHSLPVFDAWRDMDEILLLNFMAFADVVRETRYDLWIGDEAWEVDHFLHENPELKSAPYAFLTDFVGWLPMNDEEAPLVADHNAEMVEQVERNPWIRDVALYLGEPEDVINREFGPGLPSMPGWVAERFSFPGYVLPRDFEAAPPREDGSPLVVAAVGGTASGGALLRRVVEAFALLRGDVPDARLLAVCGPRIDPSAIAAPEGATLAGYVDDLPQRLASCDLAVVQGGLATTMELIAARRPFVSVPLRDHCEQQLHVAHRLRRLGAPPPTAYEHTTPEALAALMLERLGAEVRYAPVDPGGAARAADAIAALLTERKGRTDGHVHVQKEMENAIHTA
jgi:pimeloyl-ACP methyl ester carboxylesterase/UDP:flavonoid glycosyltransferase YjiC (YdhE family)